MAVNKNMVRVAVALLIALLLAGLIFLGLKNPTVNLLGGMLSEKALVFKNTNLIGWKDGRKQWEIEAEEIWTTKNKSVTTFENVKDGTVYKMGRPVVKDLTARRVIYNNWSKEIDALGKLPGDKVRVLYALIDVENLSSEEAPFKKPRFLSLQADTISYNQNSKLAQAEGRVKIRESGITIEAEKMEIQGKAGTAKLTDNVGIMKEDTKISGNLLDADLEKDIYTVTKRVEITQKGKVAIGDVAVINNKTGSVEISGHVKFLIEKAKSLVKESSIKDLRNKEASESLGEATVITCDKLTLMSRSKDAFAEGRVLITQKGKRAKSDYAVYNSVNEMITLTGNVFIEKEKDWIKTEMVLVSVSQESFEAIGSVEAEFKIKR